MNSYEGRRGTGYQELVRRLKEKAHWTCDRCGYYPPTPSDRINILAHHLDGNELNHSSRNLAVLCNECHHYITYHLLEVANLKVKAAYRNLKDSSNRGEGY